jgi:hypothetical protein
MNFLFAIIDSIVEWIKRNPLTCILLVMIAVFAPGLYGAIFIGIGIAVLLLLAIPIIGIFKLHSTCFLQVIHNLFTVAEK